MIPPSSQRNSGPPTSEALLVPTDAMPSKREVHPLVATAKSSKGKSVESRPAEKRLASTDELRSELGLSEDTGFITRLLLLRHAALAAIAAVFLIVPAHLSNVDRVPERPLILYVLTIGVGLGALLHVFHASTGKIPSQLAILEAIGLLALFWQTPGASRYLLLMVLCQFSVGTAIYGSYAATMSALAVVALIPPIVTVRSLQFDLALTVMMCVIVPIVYLVTERVRQRERQSRQRFVDLLTGLDAVVWEGNAAIGRRTWVSPQCRDLLQLDPRALIDRWDHYVLPEDRAREQAQRRNGIATQRDFVVDFRMIGGDGRVVFVRDTVRIERDSAGKPLHMRGVLVDITRQQEAEATVRKQAQYDTLTGLPNRALFNDQLKIRLEDAKLRNEGLGVLLLDLNGFKEVNDTLGHAVGDHLLQAIAGRLMAYLSDGCVVARLGGDEFAVCVSNANSHVALQTAEQIVACLTPPITVDDMTIQAGASTGIALFPQDGEDPAELLRRADAAMYEAKQSGRAHMFAAPDDDVANVRRLQLLGELRASIVSGDFRLFHQPKLDLKTGRVVGTEGLIRWQHKQFGLLTPAEFIELSELSGLIMPLTRWVIEQGVAQVAVWRKQGFELAVALNLSVRNFFDSGLPHFIADLLRKHDVPGHLIVLEITEREVMADRALARTALAAFRSLGVKISVDDFGTGFSSLSQLQQLPIDEIKIDASFVRNMLTNKQDEVIVHSIIDLGHNLGLEVVAEGAETPAQLKALRDLGADRVQGYVINPPMPVEKFTEWLFALSGRGAPPQGSSATDLDRAMPQRSVAGGAAVGGAVIAASAAPATPPPAPARGQAPAAGLSLSQQLAQQVQLSRR
jgi:diguanylate cyclase (GGDEF)-like protein